MFLYKLHQLHFSIYYWTDAPKHEQSGSCEITPDSYNPWWTIRQSIIWKSILSHSNIKSNETVHQIVKSAVFNGESLKMYLHFQKWCHILETYITNYMFFIKLTPFPIKNYSFLCLARYSGFELPPFFRTIVTLRYQQPAGLTFSKYSIMLEHVLIIVTFIILMIILPVPWAMYIIWLLSLSNDRF